MKRTRQPPSGEIGLFSDPPLESWPELLGATAAAIRSWDFVVGAFGVQELRRLASMECVSGAAAFSRRCAGVPSAAIEQATDPARPIVMTGHQPEFIHPGIWVKGFLVDRLSADVGGMGIALVVDSDAFEELAVSAPCIRPDVRKCTSVLATGGKDACYACAPVPDGTAIEEFIGAVEGALSTLPTPEPKSNFARFGEHLLASADDARNVAELITFARRGFEASAGSLYLELPVTSCAGSRSFAGFVLDMALRAAEFQRAYNDELEAFRASTSTRSAAQPFPNLAREDSRLELPLWLLGGGRRRSLWVGPPSGGKLVVYADEEEIGRLAEGETELAADLFEQAGIAPKALTLTLFYRVFVADMFVHGTGGARYDRVTDGVIRRFYGVEPPAYVVGSLTERLPLGIEGVSDEEVADAIERLNRFRHNPDAMLDEVEFASAAERERVLMLATEKGDLVRGISTPGADRKAMGARIREVNAELREALSPLGDRLQHEVERLSAGREETRILEDRTYPFCFWAPEAIAGRVR